MEFTIEWMEHKTTTTNKNKINATLRDINKVDTQNVSIWEDFPNFKDLIVGSHVTGELVPAKDPKYGPTLYPPRVSAPRASSGPAGIKAAQERKADNIKEAQENKNENIKEAAAQRDAVLIVSTFYPELKDEYEKSEKIEMLIESWRGYFLKIGDKPPF